MNRYGVLGFFIGLLLVAGVAMAIPQTQHGYVKTIPELTGYATRACVFPAGGSTTIDASTTAASSGALNQWSRYVIQCDDDAYFAPGTAATGVDADSGDMWLPAGAWVEFMTTDTILYVSVKNKNNSNDCHYMECR